MGDPDFSLEGVNENEAFIIQDGERVMDEVIQASATGTFGSIDFTAKDESGNDYFLSCVAFSRLERLGKNRLYFAVRDLEEEKVCWRTCYIARREDGTYLLVHETDSAMHDAFINVVNEMQSEQDAEAQTSKKKKSGGWKLAFKIILFPFWLIWQFIKAVLSLFNIAVGDSSAVKSFKKGYNGDSSSMKEYTFTNSMGCTQTVYSSNGREFYDGNGAYVGKSNDNGKTIIEE